MATRLILAAGLSIVLAVGGADAWGQNAKAKKKAGDDAKTADAKAAEAKAKVAKALDGDEKKLPTDLNDLLDADGDGEVTDAEAKRAVMDLEKDSKQESDRGKMLREALDKDKDGKVDAKEAQTGVAQSRQNTAAGRRTAEAFAELDADGNEVVTEKEFLEFPNQLGPWGRFISNRLPQMFQSCDLNGDRQLTVVEMQMGSDVLFSFGRDRNAIANSQRFKQIAQETIVRYDKKPKDQKLTEKELKSNKQLSALFAEMNTNLDEFVTIEEMVEYLKASQPKPAQDDRRGPDRGRGPNRRPGGDRRAANE